MNDSDLSEPEYNQAQQAVIEQLGSTDKPTFRADLRDDLRDDLNQSLTEALQPLIDATDGDEKRWPLMLNKRALGLLHGCETRYVADQTEEFNWSIPIARGSVAHKAIELLIAHRGNPTPLDLVEGAMARIENDERDLSRYVQQLSEAERADLAGQANDFVASFTDNFPPLKRQWRPVAESRVMATFVDDKLELRGRVDLSLGRATGNKAGKVLIDLKTGRPSIAHIEDLRLYALLETLKLGVPPRLIVSYYMDAGMPRPETVTEDLLWSAARRLTDGTRKLVEITKPNPQTEALREPDRTPGLNCRFCPVLDTCEPGTHHVERVSADDWRPD